MSDRGRLLLIRRAGRLWGVAHEAVREVARRGRGYRVRLTPEGKGGAGHELDADGVEGVIEGATVRPAGGVMALYWSEPAGGLAVHGTTPLVVVDPERPPSFLRSAADRDDTEVDDGDRRQAEN